MQKNMKPLKPIHVICAALVLCAVLLFSRLATKGEGTELERRMASVLSGIKGAGEVRILINTAQDMALPVWSMADFSQENDADIIGVLIVAQGAGDPLVCAKLVQATCTVLGVEQSCISIMQMEM